MYELLFEIYCKCGKITFFHYNVHCILYRLESEHDIHL